MTDVPGIYGPLTDHEKAAYARWMMALFELTGHIDNGCPFGCCDERAMCAEGERYRDVERSLHRKWRAVRGAEVTT